MKHVLMAIKAMIIALMVVGLSSCGGDDPDSPPDPGPGPKSGSASLTLTLTQPANLPSDIATALPSVKLDDTLIAFTKWGGTVSEKIDISKQHTITPVPAHYQDSKYKYSCTAPVIHIAKNQYADGSTSPQTIKYTCSLKPIIPPPTPSTPPLCECYTGVG